MFPVNGDWESWGEWSPCGCPGSTSRTRTRECGTPSFGGIRLCPGAGNGTEAGECPPCQCKLLWTFLKHGLAKLVPVPVVYVSAMDLLFPDPQRFMVVGGMRSGSSYMTDVEILDLGTNGTTKNCTKPSDLPATRAMLVGAHLGGRPVVCGG